MYVHGTAPQNNWIKVPLPEKCAPTRIKPSYRPPEGATKSRVAKEINCIKLSKCGGDPRSRTMFVLWTMQAMQTTGPGCLVSTLRQPHSRNVGNVVHAPSSRLPLMAPA